METLEKKGKGSALLPFLLFIVIYLGAGLYFQAQGVEMAFYQFPSVTAMFIALLLAFCQGKGTIDQKFTVFAKGAANENVLTMLMIYILAGAFSTVASAMGGVDATVNLGLSVIPVHFLAAGVFVISAFMGTATGTSMGTISALIFIAGARTMVLTTMIKQLQYVNRFNEVFVLSLLILATNLAAKALFSWLAGYRSKHSSKTTKKEGIL